MWWLGRRALTALAASMLVTLAGCAHSETGVAVKAAGGPPPDAIDVELLGSGTFPTQPRPALGLAGLASTGALIDARRMADDVVGPWQVDPALVVPGPNRALAFNDAASVGLIEPAQVAASLRAHNLINGFASDRQDAAQGRLVNVVLRFPDPPSAAAAAKDMADASAGQQPGPVPSIPIPGYPDARASAVSASLDGGADNPVTVYSFTSHGAYVLGQITHAPNLDTATSLVAHTLDLQSPLIDRFTPTDPADFAGLAVDPSGLLAHTLPEPTWPGERPTPPNPNVGIYLPNGALHLQNDPIDVSAALSAAGVQQVSYYNTTVFQARDPNAAAQLAGDLADIAVRTDQAAPINGVDFMPPSRCVQTESRSGPDSSEFYCYASVGPYAFEVHSFDATGAREQAAAQYKMLLAR